MIGQVTPDRWPGVLAAGGFLGNTWDRWLGLGGLILGSLIVGKVISFFLDRQARRLDEAERAFVLSALLRSLAGPVTLLIMAGGLYLASTFMTLADFTKFWLQTCTTTAVLAATWFVFKLVNVLEHFLKGWTAKTETSLDDQLVPLIRKALRVFIVIVSALFLAQNIFEWDIGALIAGLGLGGLAFALAAKDLLANLFGSLAIFADRPFTLGERVRINNQDGQIEEVGFRSTRIRTLAGHLVTIPNATVANEMIENIGRRPYIKRVLDVTVTYDTSPEKVAEGIGIIQEMLDARAAENNFPPDLPGKVYFSEFNAASLNIVVYYWFTPPDWWQYLQFTHEFNMELLRRFNAAGIEFAFPTQTLYVKQDSPIAADVQVKPGTAEG